MLQKIYCTIQDMPRLLPAVSAKTCCTPTDYLHTKKPKLRILYRESVVGNEKKIIYSRGRPVMQAPQLGRRQWFMVDTCLLLLKTAMQGVSGCCIPLFPHLRGSSCLDFSHPFLNSCSLLAQRKENPPKTQPWYCKEGGLSLIKVLLSVLASAFLTQAMGFVNRLSSVCMEKAVHSILGNKFSFSIIIF